MRLARVVRARLELKQRNAPAGRRPVGQGEHGGVQVVVAAHITHPGRECAAGSAAGSGGQALAMAHEFVIHLARRPYTMHNTGR